jgi:hypothetical protein
MAKEKSLAAAAPRDVDDSKPLVVRRGRVESVDLYEIKDSELDLLEHGGPADLQLNFAVFLFSIAFSAICALATATFANKTVESAFLVVSVIGVLLGAYLIISWLRVRSSTKEVCARIRKRIPPDLPLVLASEQESDSEEPTDGEPEAPQG